MTQQATARDFADVGADLGDADVAAAFAAAEPIHMVVPGSFSPREGPTEESLAREWAYSHCDDWRFDFGVKSWFYWDGVRWCRDLSNLAFHLIGEHLRAAGEAVNKPTIARAAVARGVEAFAVVNPKCAIPHDSWDADPWRLGTPAGTVDLRTGNMRSARRGDWITRSTAVAPASGKPTRWLRFIDEATNGDEELGRFLQLALGYCLTGSTREHALFFAYGAGKNGKSVFLNTVSRIMGDYVTTAAMDTFTASKGDRHPTELARLDGARLVAASETEEGRRWDESRIKALTGGDRIAARYMNQDFFEFTPRFKLFIVGNFQPVLRNVDEATRRRLNIIPFVHMPPRPDKELEEKLAAEHPQILAWMIDGARQWNESGLFRPQAVSNATDRYFENQDLHGQWLAERCEVRAGAIGKTGHLFESWRQFATENGEHVGSQRTFGDVLEKRGFPRDRKSGLGRVHLGLDVRGGHVG